VPGALCHNQDTGEISQEDCQMDSQLSGVSFLRKQTEKVPCEMDNSQLSGVSYSVKKQKVSHFS
jgi:hypothetical protein